VQLRTAKFSAASNNRFSNFWSWTLRNVCFWPEADLPHLLKRKGPLTDCGQRLKLLIADSDKPRPRMSFEGRAFLVCFFAEFHRPE
jgi:hypothetical protein